jgi:signal recognition particle subunit SRP54
MFDFLSKKFSSIFSSLTGQSSLTEANIDQTLHKVKDSLLEADVSYGLVNTFIDDVKKEVIGTKVTASVKPGELFIKIVYDKLLAFLGGEYIQKSFTFQIPSTIMVMGLQGSGKTTTIGKLAQFIKKQAEKRGKKREILLASVDFYRPAAVDQLEILAKQVGVDFYRSPSTDPVEAAADIHREYKSKGYELLLFDTAGRLHVDESMMDELQQVKKIIKPRYSFIVLDAMTGQESLQVAETFEKQIAFDYAVLSKMDSDARGGAAFSFRYALKKPVLFMGTGEKIDNLELFRPERIAKRMLGMGDILTLVENAQEKIKQSEQDDIERSLRSGNITLDDFLKQLQMVAKLGSLSSIMKFIPGMSNMNVTQEKMDQGDKEMKLFTSIIRSMTKKERVVPAVLDGSRKERVARGSGVTVEQVNKLLEKFEQSKHFVKMLKNKKLFR